jgi:hypothetical protein
MVDEFLESRQTRVPLAAAWSSSSSSSSQMALATTTSASAAQSHGFLVVAAHLLNVLLFCYFFTILTKLKRNKH